MASSGSYNDRTFNLAAQGPSPARLDLQDDGPDDGDPAGRRPGQDLLHVEAARAPDPAATAPGTSRPTAAPTRATVDLVTGDADAPTTRCTRSSTSTSGRRRSPRPRTCSASRRSSTASRRRASAVCASACSPLEMARAYATLASGGIRHKPIAIRKVKFADGKSDNFTSDKGKRVLTDGAGLRGHEDPREERAGRHRHARRRSSAARRPARPARPTTSTTRGSTATRPISRPPSGSATRTRSRR